MKLFMIYGSDPYGPEPTRFKTYLVAAPGEAEARAEVPEDFEIISVETTDTTDKSPHVLFWTTGAIEPIDW